MVGDGSYLMLNTEIVTAVAEGLAFTIVVLDNHGYQCIHDLARRPGCATSATSSGSATRTRNRLTGDYLPIDFAPARRGDGRPGQSPRAPPDEIRAALARPAPRPADRHRRPDVARQAGPGPEGWWDVPVAEAQAQDNIHEARERYELGVARQRRELL